MINKENSQRKRYTYVFMMSLACLILGLVFLSNHIVSKVLQFQKHIIGVLQEQDEAYAQTYLHAMFETMNESTIEKGETVLQQYGYTDAGIYFITQNMGLHQSMIIAGLLFVLLVSIIIVCLYRMMLIQKREMELLRQENNRLKECQMEEEYISSQNKRIQSFIENIAHQMKTPLSRVYTSLDIVEESLIDDTAKQHVEECYQHLDSMNELMRRLLDIGRLEAGKVIFQKELLHVKEMLEDLKVSFHTEALRIQIHCENEINFYGDEKWLKEAFSNILINALEADKSKSPVEISCVKNSDYIKFSIRDHGPGLSEKDIPNIFDRFYLPENVKQNHTGIGLNLAKLIIEGHQGTLYVYNHLEGGAVFQIILPVYDSLKVRV